MWKKINIGESQIPQILCVIAGAVTMLAYILMDYQGFGLLTLLFTQASCIMIACYDEREEEKKANAEAFAMLESRVKSNG